MEKRVKIAILGAGTSGMSAWREVSKVTDDFVLINGGPYGTTCARVGCMPSKLLIQSANDFYRRTAFAELGIEGIDGLRVDTQKVLQRVRKYRDGFVSGVLKSIESLGDKSIQGYARFEEPGVLRVGDQRIIAERVILAVGTRPFVPKSWESEEDRIITSDEIFEVEELPKSCFVVGAGVIGLELGQAMSRLGSRVKVVGGSPNLAFLSDPKVNQYAIDTFKSEFDSFEVGKLAEPKDSEDFEKVLMVAGRKPNFDLLDFEKSGISVNDRGYPDFDPHTMQILGSDNMYIAGDIVGDRPVLHEAADEGRIAGFNVTRDEPKRFRRRAHLGIIFSEPNLAFCGSRYAEVKNLDPIVGEISFEDQGRSRIMLKAKGLLRLYADRKTGKLLGSELIGPATEHLAHLISWSIQQNMSVFDMLSMPYYHPVVEEGLRTAIRDITYQVEGEKPDLEIPPCGLLDHECLVE